MTTAALVSVEEYLGTSYRGADELAMPLAEVLALDEE
jgi:hypothetical protein